MRGTKSLKILIYIESNINSVAGALRSFCNLANAMAARGHNVYAICNDTRSGRPFYPLDDRVHFIILDGSWWRALKPGTWIKNIRPLLPTVCKEMWDRHISTPIRKKKWEPFSKLIREVQPDAVIFFGLGAYFTVQHPIPNNPMCFVSLRTSGESFVKGVDTSEKIEKINACPHLHVLQHSFAKEIQNANIYHGSIHAIPNDVAQIEEKDLADLTVEKTQKTITMISRLHSGKQQHLLIEAFARLAKDYPDWQVKIYGPPHKRRYLRKLQRMIVSFDLTGQVELMGTTNQALGVLRDADIFAFPSNFHEGWGRALTEAMSVGLPCVGLKTTPSVNELIVDGVNGFLTDNTAEDFAEKLKTLMDDRELRVKMGKAGNEMVKQYAPEKIYDQWEKLLFNALTKPQS